MKFKLIFLFFAVSSCVNYSQSYDKNIQSYYSTGFAFIKENKESSTRADMYEASHNQLNKGTKIRITNPVNLEFVIIETNKKETFNSFYKVEVNQNLAKKLRLNISFPYVEVSEIKKNKSFIEKKAITENDEKKIANNAPVDKINISNITKNKKKKVKIKSNKYSILIASFSEKESAVLLKDRLSNSLNKNSSNLIYISKKNKKNYDLLIGPYNTINKLKNDYIVLMEHRFEDLDIKKYD